MYVRGFSLLLVLFRMWRRLPASQKRRVLKTVGRHGPRAAYHVARQARAFRRARASL